jgi:hypothetical protein
MGCESYERVIMNNEFRKVWMEAVIACFNVISQNFLRGTQQKQEKCSQDNWHLNQELNPGLPEYEAGILNNKL